MEDIEKIAKKVLNNRATSMSISRVPKEIRENFMKLAEDHFCDDYGMTLKFLMDNYQRSSTFEYLVEEIDTLKNTLMQSLVEQETPQKKTLSGKPIGGKKNEQN